jgi:hypothetical protein
MDLQQIAVISIVAGAAAWLVWKFVLARKKGCGCGEECSTKAPSSARKP